MPPTIAYPSGRRDADPAPSPIATGSAPMIVATDVIRMGRSRIRPASTAAATVSMPRAFSWLVYSTSRIEFLVTRPMRRIMPIWLYRFRVDRTTNSVASAPVTANGTASSTVNGCTSDSNCEASTMNTTTSATPNAKYNAPPLSLKSRDSPARAVELPLGGVELDLHVVQLVVAGEGAHPTAAQERLQRRGDVSDRHAQVLGAVAVEGHRELGLVDAEIGVDIDQPLDGARLRGERIHRLAEHGEVGVLHHVLHRETEAAERGRDARERQHAGNAEELRLHFGDHLLHVALPLAPVGEPDEHDALAHPPLEADDAEVRFHVLRAADDLLDLPLVAIHVG